MWFRYKTRLDPFWRCFNKLFIPPLLMCGLTRFMIVARLGKLNFLIEMLLLLMLFFPGQIVEILQNRLYFLTGQRFPLQSMRNRA